MLISNTDPHFLGETLDEEVMHPTPITNGCFIKLSAKKEFPLKKNKRDFLDKGIENIYSGKSKVLGFFLPFSLPN